MTIEHNAYETKCGTFTSQTTPSSNQTICSVEIGPKYIIPIIFIPGIMGSNIKNNEGKEVWFPPNGKLAGLGAAVHGKFFRIATKRQQELNPETTHVSNEGKIDIKKNAITGFDEELARKRGWGTVYWDGYGEALIYLEKFLNHDLIVKNSVTPSAEINSTQTKNDVAKAPPPFNGSEPWKILVGKDKALTEMIIKGTWKPTKDFKLLVEEEFSKVANFHFPVFALGYNWLQSNGISSADIATRLTNQVKMQIKAEFPKATFKKFIIVTHSMGGLVTRSLILNESIKDDILAVIHGVMPASGAPTVYKRFANGWDGKEVTGSIIDDIAKHVFGATCEKLTPVLANAPGGLELLPFANFVNTGNSKKWLTLIANDKNGIPVKAQLPRTDNPYKEIYSDTRSWWRMINKDYLDPASILKNKLNSNNSDSEEDGLNYSDDQSPQSSDINLLFIRNIQIVSTLHEQIKDSYHDNTYAHYGNDSKHVAFNEVVWETKQNLDISTPDDLIYYTGQALSNSVKPITNPVTGETIIPEVELYKWDKDLFEEDGERRIKRKNGEDIVFKLHVAPNKETGWGDGTVCHQSAADVQREKVKQVFVIDGYDHANSYKNKDVLSSVLYSIGKIVGEYDPEKA